MRNTNRNIINAVGLLKKLGGVSSIPYVASGDQVLTTGTISMSYVYASDINVAEDNPPPYVENLTITNNGTGVVGDTFTVNYDFVSPCGYAESGTTYQWYRADENLTNLELISGATAQNYIAVNADADKLLLCDVTPSQTASSPANGNPSGDTVRAESTTVIGGGVTTTKIDINFRRNGLASGQPKPPSLAINELTHTITSIANALDIDNNLTGYGLAITSNNGLPGLDDGNLTGNTTIFSDESLDTHLDTVKGLTETLTISGVPDTASFSIEFMGTQSFGQAGINRIGTITAGGASGTEKSSGTYDAYQQTSTVRIENVSSDGAGNLLVVFTSTGTAGANNWLPMSSIRIEITA